MLYYDGIEKKLDKMLEIGDIDAEAYDLLKAWIDSNSVNIDDDDEEWDDEEYTHESYHVRKYKEQDTACDKCPDLKACAAEGKIIEITTSQDTRRHFMRGLMVVCNRSL